MTDNQIIPIFGPHQQIDAVVLRNHNGTLLMAMDLKDDGSLQPYVAVVRDGAEPVVIEL